uniref:Phage tail protein n=1 Tax=Meiothermus ruber TaxID=277 RepID=A0A7C3HVX3_MEIRU
MSGPEIDLLEVRLYEDWLPELAPPWLQGPRGRALLEGWGKLLDEYASLAATAILARFAQLAPEDALNLLGAERGLTRYPGESLEAWRERVLGAWEYWRWSGTEYGLSVALFQLGYSSAITPVWSYDPNRWSEFEVFIYPATRSYDGTEEEKNRILSIINQVKPAHTRLAQATYVAFGPLTWDPPGLSWDPPGQTWGDTPIILYP